MKYLNLDPKNRPRDINKEIRKELIEYIRKEVKEKHFPSRREIEKKFKIRLDSYFNNIKHLYEESGARYKLHANQNLKVIKAKLLLKLILKNLNKINLKLISARGINERGIDILAKQEEIKVGIEIKAYNKEEKLKARDIQQVKKFIEKEKLDKAIIITTSNKRDNNLKISNNILIIDYNTLVKILREEDKELLFIRNYSINREDISRNIKKQRILNYVERKYKGENKKPTCIEIAKKLHLDIYSYFINLSEIYKILKIPPPLKNMGGKKGKKPDKESIELWKTEFKRYMLKTIKDKKVYPSGDTIAKHFKIGSIWNITNMTDIYKELGFKPYLERDKRITSVQAT